MKPTPLPPGTPPLSFTLDVDVDNFIEVVKARTLKNVTGLNLAVAVIDTGINADHVDFAGKIIPGKNFSTTPGKTDTTDLHGHGSNVSGIIAGRLVNLREPLATRSLHTGVAPDAKIIPLKVFPGGGFGKINAALDWVIENQSQFNIGVVNMSLGTNENLQDVSGITDDASKGQQDRIRKLRNMNVVVTVSAGNFYKAFNPDQGMGFPAICKETVSVGAIFPKNQQPDNGPPLVVYHDGLVVNFAIEGRCTPFSQRLSDAVGKEFRTDIFSPGFHVVSAGATDPTDPATSRRNQTQDDGTSQASPVTAGVVHLLQQRYRDLLGQNDLPPVDLIEECLREGGEEFTDLDDAPAHKMAEVQSTGAKLRRLKAFGALDYLDKKLRQSPTRPQAIAQIQKHYRDLMGVTTPAPDDLVEECLKVADKQGKIDADAALQYLDKRFREDAVRFQAAWLRAPSERAHAIRETSILRKKLDRALSGATGHPPVACALPDTPVSLAGRLRTRPGREESPNDDLQSVSLSSTDQPRVGSDRPNRRRSATSPG